MFVYYVWGYFVVFHRTSKYDLNVLVIFSAYINVQLIGS